MGQGELGQREWCEGPSGHGIGWALDRMRPGGDVSKLQGIPAVQGLRHVCPLDLHSRAQAGGGGVGQLGGGVTAVVGLRTPRNTCVGSELEPQRTCLK